MLVATLNASERPAEKQTSRRSLQYNTHPGRRLEMVKPIPDAEHLQITSRIGSSRNPYLEPLLTGSNLNPLTGGDQVLTPHFKHLMAAK